MTDFKVEYNGKYVVILRENGNFADFRTRIFDPVARALGCDVEHVAREVERQSALEAMK